MSGTMRRQSLLGGPVRRPATPRQLGDDGGDFGEGGLRVTLGRGPGRHRETVVGDPGTAVRQGDAGQEEFLQPADAPRVVVGGDDVPGEGVVRERAGEHPCTGGYVGRAWWAVRTGWWLAWVTPGSIGVRVRAGAGPSTAGVRPPRHLRAREAPVPRRRTDSRPAYGGQGGSPSPALAGAAGAAGASGAGEGGPAPRMRSESCRGASGPVSGPERLPKTKPISAMWQAPGGLRREQGVRAGRTRTRRCPLRSAARHSATRSAGMR